LLLVGIKALIINLLSISGFGFHRQTLMQEQLARTEMKRIKGLFEATTILHDEVHASV